MRWDIDLDRHIATSPDGEELPIESYLDEDDDEMPHELAAHAAACRVRQGTYVLIIEIGGPRKLH